MFLGLSCLCVQLYSQLGVLNSFSGSKFSDLTWFSLGLLVATGLIIRMVSLLYINYNMFACFDVLKGQWRWISDSSGHQASGWDRRGESVFETKGWGGEMGSQRSSESGPWERDGPGWGRPWGRWNWSGGGGGHGAREGSLYRSD